MPPTVSSPPPRRTVHKRAASVEHASPPLHRRRQGGSRLPSRLGTPAVGMVVDRPTPIRDDESYVSGMDVDERGSEFGIERGLKSETIFAKSEELQVNFYAHLPAEVKLVLRNADFKTDAYTGQVDTVTGFALVASLERCFVWNYSQALTGTPTCYIFACPQDVSPLPMANPLHALIPYGTAREPGLILASPGGKIHCWDSLGMGLAGGERAFKADLELSSDYEQVTTLTRADAQTYILSTSAGRLFRLSFTALGGKHVLTTHPFSRPQSSLSFSRLLSLPSFLSSSPGVQAEPGNINAVALSTAELTLAVAPKAAGRDIWILIDSRLQRWTMSVESGWEELVLDQDVLGMVAPEVRTRFTPRLPEQYLPELDIEFLDLQIVRPGSFLVLISFAAQDSDQNDFASSSADTLPPKRIYCIIPIAFDMLTGTFSIDQQAKIVKVPYQSTSSSGAPMHPRMQLLTKGGAASNGSIIAIQFGDTVVLCAPSTEYTDRLELKSTSDRTLGLAVLPLEDEQNDDGTGGKTLIVLTAATLMKVLVDRDQVASFRSATGRANLIRSTMTQAILYGAHPENPLQFSFPPDVDEEALMSGAEQLSHAIMESDVEVVRPNHDLQTQLAHRKERLSFLIKFINDNGVLPKMSQASRQQLATDAEKLYAADQLWIRHNDLLATGQPHNVLTEAIYTYMSAAGEGHHEDFMRAFFRLKVNELGALLPHVADVLKRSEHEVTHSQSETVPQANDVLLMVLQSAYAYRSYNQGVYGLELPLTRPWTSTATVIDIASEFFEATAHLVESPATAAEPSVSRTQAKSQLPEVAEILFSVYREQIEWLSSPRAASEAGNERERVDLEERFKQARPVILETLRRTGFAEQAFRLAEKYRDFRSLASLCHKDTVYPPQNNPHSRRIQSYIDKFKEEFATELYQWYIEHGELRTMYAQDQPEYLDKFFAEYNYPSVSWIHDLERGRYGLAADSLLSEAQSAPELSSKHLMLSIGKLACLAQAQEGDAPADDQTLDAFHDGLDFVSVHEALTEELKTALVNVRARQSLDAQVDIIARAKASRISDRRALFSIFKQLVKRLLQGKALSIEDAADVLSLKDNETSAEDYITALHLLCQAQIPDARRLSAFRSVWRRIYLHDDWTQIRHTVGASDAEITARFRRTAFHDVLVATMVRQDYPEGYVLYPDQAVPAPTPAEVASRWPGMPPDDIAALVRDYEWESQQLNALQLEDVVDRIRELANEDIRWS
ncbi:hypothetical protein BDW22DRAFT_1358408 [Trametopsis cervina]|nr:hypothetical protein BDW22DRAFT_1358408 [Trametopsis cervina]